MSKILYGVIQENGTVLADDGTLHYLPKRGVDREGYPEVMIDAKNVGGAGFYAVQSLKPYIGLKVQFQRMNAKANGYNFTIV